jgi:GTP cyclohydrolase IA
MIERIRETPQDENPDIIPERATSLLRSLPNDYLERPDEIPQSAKFRGFEQEIILVKGLELHAICEHNLLPFWGKINIAYVPDQYTVEFDTLQQIVEVVSSRPQIQERLTNEIANAIQIAIQPLGIGIKIEANHASLMKVGQGQAGSTVTATFKGCFMEEKWRNLFWEY